MLSCLFCKRKKKLFKIYVIYGETACPIKDYILDFFGPVEKHLNEEQGICKTCVFVLNNLLYIKNFMYQALVTIAAEDAYRVQPEFAFACMFKLFRHNLRKVDYERSKSGQSSPDLFTYTKSPNNELVESNVQSDEYEVQSNHSLLREGTPYADREVQRVLAKRKKRRSSERNVKTALSRTNSLASFRSEPAYKKRWSTDFSDNNSDFSEEERGMSKLRFNKDGILLNKKTRSVSRIISKSDAAYAVYTESVYKCVDGCMEEYEDLTKLTEHKIKEHRMLAKYWCYECYMTKFTSQEDLDKHNNLMHKTLITNCPLCSEEMQNQEELQKHLAEHRIHSVPCNYCDKFFLNGRSCESHIREYHKGRKKRIKRRRPQTILDRIDKEISNENGPAEEHGIRETEAFVKVLIQSVPAEEVQQQVAEEVQQVAEEVQQVAAEEVQVAEEVQQVAETVSTANNMDEDSSSCNCDENSTEQQVSSEVTVSFEVPKDTPATQEEDDDNAADNTLEETSPGHGGSGMLCDIEEEICVTALEETFEATVHEISVAYIENENENEMCSTQEDEGEENEGVYLDSYSHSKAQPETRGLPLEDEQRVQNYDDDDDVYDNHISNICHEEEIITDNTEYVEVTSADHVNQNKTSAEDDVTDNQNGFSTKEMHQEEVIIDDSQIPDAIEHMEINSYVVDDSLLSKYDRHNISLPDAEKCEREVTDHQNKTNSQLKSGLSSSSPSSSFSPKKLRISKKQKTRRKNLAARKAKAEEAPPARPQLKIVLERLKIGNDFLQDLLVKSPIINNATPSTSSASPASKPNAIKPAMKKKRLKKVTASVKTPVHYRRLQKGKVYREKKLADNSLKDKLGIYDFKEEDDGDDKPTKNSFQRNLKAKVFHKGKSKASSAAFPSSASVKTNVVVVESDSDKKAIEKYRTSTKVKRPGPGGNSLRKGKSKRRQV